MSQRRFMEGVTDELALDQTFQEEGESSRYQMKGADTPGREKRVSKNWRSKNSVSVQDSEQTKFFLLEKCRK